MPAIISKEIWEQAQFLLKDKPKRNVRAGSGQPCHRYTGLIKCGDCGSSFVCKTRKWREYPDRIEYTCNGNHRYGKEHCTPHRIDEKTLDKLIYDELILIKDSADKNFKSIEKDMKKWLSGKNTAQNKIKKLTVKLEQRKNDQQEILLERIRDKAHADAYTEMLKKCEDDIQSLMDEIKSITDYDSTIKKRRKEIKHSTELIEQIVKDGAVSDTNLRMLIDEIVITEKDKKLNITISLKAEFRRHLDFYDENGEISEIAFAI